MLSEGKDPSIEKKREKLRGQLGAASTFTAVAAQFCEKRKRDGTKGWAPATAARIEYLLSLLRGSIGHMPIAEIQPIDILGAVRRIERKGQFESARRMLQLAGAVFRYAVATARIPSDPHPGSAWRPDDTHSDPLWRHYRTRARR